MSVMRSARCIARTSEKCPTSAESSVFCLSTAAERRPVSECPLAMDWLACDIPGWLESPLSLAMLPLEPVATALFRFDMAVR